MRTLSESLLYSHYLEEKYKTGWSDIDFGMGGKWQVYCRVPSSSVNILCLFFQSSGKA